jgi:hypothetical protein
MDNNICWLGLQSGLGLMETLESIQKEQQWHGPETEAIYMV